MERVFGIETEYGITIAGGEAIDVVAESIALVRSYMNAGALMKWDYAMEDPHRDARGFRASELLQDTDEAAYFEVDRNRPLRFEEIKSDLVLATGARFYNDHAHPEYSTPECTTLRQLVAHDKAGERIVAQCARRRNAQLPHATRVVLYKNNTDFVGHSYGCHDNYLVRRELPWPRLVAGMLPFLVTRQIFAGAGKLGIEGEETAGRAGVFQLSQRADFFSVIASIDTMNKRPLINTRDEPHADATKYRRFHVILGDSNRSEWATALKIGTTAAVLDLIERRAAPALELAQPVAALKQISRDQTYRWQIELADGRTISAIDVQRLYLAAVKQLEQNDERRWLLREWEKVLDDLASHPEQTHDRIDWAAKKFLLQSFREAEQLKWDDPWLQAVDLQYHNVADPAGLYEELVRQGAMQRVVSEQEIHSAMLTPPTTTRAYLRGRAVARFHREIESLQWDEIAFDNSRRALRIALPEPGRTAELAFLCSALDNAANYEQFASQVLASRH